MQEKKVRHGIISIEFSTIFCILQYTTHLKDMFIMKDMLYKMSLKF